MTAALRIHRVPFSTNVERIALACGIKGVEVEWVDHDNQDRSAIHALSGQDLVPVLESGETVLTDSMPIVAWIDERHPDPPLYPADPGQRREVEGFVTWFNHVWKVPPNAIAAGVGDPREWQAQMRGWLPGFEGLLCLRDFFFGSEPGAADICAFPFLRYAVTPPRPGDGDPFHRVLHEHLALEGAFPRIEAWIDRMQAVPQA